MSMFIASGVDVQVVVFDNRSVYPAYLVTLRLRHRPPWPYKAPVRSKFTRAERVAGAPQAAWLDVLG